MVRPTKRSSKKLFGLEKEELMKVDYHRLISNAVAAQERSGTEWGKIYWGRVIEFLTKKVHEDEVVH